MAVAKCSSDTPVVPSTSAPGRHRSTPRLHRLTLLPTPTLARPQPRPCSHR
jgi:hypothetical protein